MAPGLSQEGLVSARLSPGLGPHEADPTLPGAPRGKEQTAPSAPLGLFLFT